MRVLATVLLVILGLSCSLADDRSFCEGKCAKKYTDDKINSACLSGCSHRGSAADGARGFIQCHSACEEKHNQTDSEERKACDYACSLPITNIVMMKVDYGTGDAAPKVEIVRKEGGDILGSDIGMGEDFNQFLMRAKNLNGGLSSGETEEDGGSDEFGLKLMSPLLKSMRNFDADDEKFNQVQENLDKLVQSFFDQSHMASKVAEGRPTGHDGLVSLLGPSVGNKDGEGNNILFVSPLEGDDFADLRHFERSQREPSFRRRFPALFQMSVFVVLLLAIVCLALIVMLMLRQMRVNRYRSLQSQAQSNLTVSAPLPIVEAGEMVKKMPLDMEEPYPAPEGCPPPAYDQLSVHSKKNEQ